MSIAGTREIKFITFYILVMLFFSISRETTQFFYPDVGEQVYEVINFYFVRVVALMVLIVWLAQARAIPVMPKVPALWAVLVNFSVFFLPAFVIFSILFTGGVLPSFNMDNFIIQTIVSFSENFLAFILLPAVIGWGTGTGTIAEGNIFTLRGYTMRYAIPTLNRLKYSLPSIAVIAVWHVGSYSKKAASWEEFYLSVFIAFGMFIVFLVLKETFGFGASEAAHDAWNVVVSSIRGSIL